jgi:xyloglucan-specific exo-beta-1,4-glucanase
MRVTPSRWRRRTPVDSPHGAGPTPAPPEVDPKLGWMTEALAIDPFNSNRMFYGTGETLYGTTNLTNWDTGGTITIKPYVAGLEETAVNALISPPSGAPAVRTR